MLRCKRRHLRDLGFGDVFGIHATYGGTLVMNLEHDLRRAFLAHRKKSFQNLDDKLHSGVVIVHQNHLVELGQLGFAALQQIYVFLLGCHCLLFSPSAQMHI
jgi:hypothetical protein